MCNLPVINYAMYVLIRFVLVVFLLFICKVNVEVQELQCRLITFYDF